MNNIAELLACAPVKVKYEPDTDKQRKLYLILLQQGKRAEFNSPETKGGGCPSAGQLIGKYWMRLGGWLIKGMCGEH